MRLIEFAQDVLRFAKHGLLLRFCWLLFGRIEVLVCACVIVALFEYASMPQTKIMVGVLAVFIAAWLFVMFTIQFLSPLYFGSFVVGRLNVKARPSGITPRGYDEFVLLPSGPRAYVTYHRKISTTGIEGNRYLLLQHPLEKEVALALIDDDPGYMELILGYADRERAVEIADRLNEFRKTTPIIPQGV